MAGKPNRGRRPRRVPGLLSRVLPRSPIAWAKARARRVWPPGGTVRFGSLRRLRLIGESFGTARETPIDRHYIEGFLDRHSGRPGYVLGDIRGRVLEIGEDSYARRFGTPYEGDEEEIPAGYISSVDVLHYDVRAAIRNIHRTLKPGGVALVTVPGISQLCRPDFDLWGDYWRFTSLSARRPFEEVFPPENVVVETHGNVLVATAFLYGVVVEELGRAELDVHDPDYDVTLTVSATKPA